MVRDHPGHYPYPSLPPPSRWPSSHYNGRVGICQKEIFTLCWLFLRSCYLNRWFCKFVCISVSTIDLLGPGQHWQNQQVLKCTLEKLKSESCQTKQNKLCQNQQVSKCTLEKLESESCQTKQIVSRWKNVLEQLQILIKHCFCTTKILNCGI